MTRVVTALSAIALAATLAACETTAPAPPPRRQPPPPPPPTPIEEFAWSTRQGANTLTGTVVYRPGAGQTWSCAGQSVALTPETSYSRGRMISLYGSADRALQTVSAVRTRSAATPGLDYSQFVRSTTCDARDNFAFAGLPDGGYFIIARVSQTAPANASDGMVIMQRVELRGGQATRIVLPQGQYPAAGARPGQPRPAPRPAQPRR